MARVKSENVMPINWGKISKQNSLLINHCVKRIVRRNPEIDATTMTMDLSAVHISCPLDLLGLLGADDFNFAHDMFGIRRHMNRDTGKLENCFLPRCAI